MVHVTMGIKMIPDTQKIFRVYSGHGRRFFDEFEKLGVAFLELPDSGITPNIFQSVEETRRHVRRAREIAEFYRKNKRPPLPNVVDLRQYSGKPDKDDRSGNSLIGSVTALYRDAKPGDLIISPSAGPYREVLYGEIISPFSEKDSIALEQFGDLRVPVRKVRWFKRTSQEDLVPFELSEFLAGRKAVAAIRRKGPALRFFDIAYGSYVTTEYSRAEVLARYYRSDNAFETSELTDLLGYLIAAYAAVSSGEEGDLSTLTERQAIRQFIDHDTLEYYRQHFNSPGKATFKSTMKALAPSVAIMLALAADAQLVPVAKGADVEISVKTGQITEDQCKEYSESVRQMAISIGVRRCGEIEKSVQALNKELGLEAPATVDGSEDADGG